MFVVPDSKIEINHGVTPVRLRIFAPVMYILVSLVRINSSMLLPEAPWAGRSPVDDAVDYCWFSGRQGLTENAVRIFPSLQVEADGANASQSLT